MHGNSKSAEGNLVGVRPLSGTSTRVDGSAIGSALGTVLTIPAPRNVAQKFPNSLGGMLIESELETASRSASAIRDRRAENRLSASRRSPHSIAPCALLRD
jgi:hypothetical protein